MGGVLVDIAALVVVASFAWAGYTLGLVRSAVRLVGALGAVGLAVLLRELVAKVITALTPFSDDFASLFGMLLVGAASYLAVAALVTYYAGWVPHERLFNVDRALGTIPGFVLGVMWCGLMVSLLVLTPSDGFLSRSAIRSLSGGVMIEHASGALRWLNDGFPHYTQTLPKGKRGAVVGTEAGELPMRDTGSVSDVPDDAGVLLANINAYRDSHDKAELNWNIDVAEVASRHSRSMVVQRFLGTKTPDGLEFEDRIKGALGNNVDLYHHFGAQVVWSHAVPNAYAALVRDSESREMLLDERFTEVGIGVADGGWFNGAMFTIGLIGRSTEDPAVTDGSQDADAADAGLDDGADEQDPSAA